jgi:hypothetical protein
MNASKRADPPIVLENNLLHNKTSKKLSALSYDDALFYYIMYFGADNLKIHSIILICVLKLCR